MAERMTIMNTNYFIRNNATRKLELHFDKATYNSLGDEEKREIRSNFRWTPKYGCWLSRYMEPNLGKAIELANALGIEDAGIKNEEPSVVERCPASNNMRITSEERDMLRTEYEKIWDKSPKMVDYCVSKAASIALLPNGEIVVIEKQHIETHFCFGESGVDYDDAVKAAQHARTSADYFKRENMKDFESWIDKIKESLEGGNDHMIFYPSYTLRDVDCRLVSVSFAKTWDILDAAYDAWSKSPVTVKELEGKSLTIRNVKSRVATQEEQRIVLQAFETAAKQHEKKVDAYLKRYGTSKVYSWTYWRDA